MNDTTIIDADTMPHSERMHVAIAMREYGGSFTQGLGMALMHADPANTSKIKNTWPELWEHYMKIKLTETEMQYPDYD